MIVISDTNILSSFAAGEALQALQHLFIKSGLAITPAIARELQQAKAAGVTYLDAILQAIDDGQLPVVTLSKAEVAIAGHLPRKLNAGECEAIAVVQARQGLLLTNDRRALRHCEQADIEALGLIDVLRLLWTQSVLSKRQVNDIIERMKVAEGIVFNEPQIQTIFARQRKRSNRRA